MQLFFILIFLEKKKGSGQDPQNLAKVALDHGRLFQIMEDCSRLWKIVVVLA
jgi:hypothetical protein